MPRVTSLEFIALSIACFLAVSVPAVAAGETPDEREAQATRSAEMEAAPSLARVIAAAQKGSPETLLARAQLDTSRAALVGAKLPGLGNPRLEVVAGRGNRGVTRDVEVMSSLSLPIELAGQRGRRIAEAEAYVSLHSTLLDQVRALATGAAVRAWGTAIGETARIQALEELGRLAEDEYRIIAARRLVGDATMQDEQLAALESSRHRELLAEAQGSLIRATAELERVTGLTWGTLGGLELRAPIEGLTQGRTTAELARLPSVLTHKAEAEFHGKTAERYEREGWTPLSVLLHGGRGDFGETRLGVGLGMDLPVFRRFQGERARAEGDRRRASTQAALQVKLMEQRLTALRREVSQTRKALDTLETSTMPAANAALQAATDLRRAGKSDYLPMLIARREVTSQSLRRIDLSQKEWELLGDWVEVTGRLP